jgi:hypothetical protein
MLLFPCTLPCGSGSVPHALDCSVYAVVNLIHVEVSFDGTA